MTIYDYKHWSKYTTLPENMDSRHEVPLDSKVESEFWDFAAERMNIYYRKASGQPAPWTSDVFLQKFYFTNCYRELDKTTIKWNELIQPYIHDTELLFANLAYMRFCNKIETIEELGLLTSLDPRELAQKKARYEALDTPKNSSAYLFPVTGAMNVGAATRQEFLFEYIPKIAKASAKIIDASDNQSVTELVEQLLAPMGFKARFHLSEICMDLGYVRPNMIDERKDFPIGPGAKPMAKLLNSKATPNDVAMTLMKHQPKEFPHLTIGTDKILLTTANVEQCLCEARKYANLNKGEGRKRYYNRIK